MFPRHYSRGLPVGVVLVALAAGPVALSRADVGGQSIGQSGGQSLIQAAGQCAAAGGAGLGVTQGTQSAGGVPCPAAPPPPPPPPPPPAVTQGQTMNHAVLTCMSLKAPRDNAKRSLDALMGGPARKGKAAKRKRQALAKAKSQFDNAQARYHANANCVKLLGA